MTIDLAVFPALNATLNAINACLLVLAYVMVRRGRISAHKKLMLTACGVAVLFLTSYIYYHAHHGFTRFPGQGISRVVYFTILISHTILAIVIVPMIIKVLIHAFRGQLHRHKKFARITMPLWLYVSVTGVVVYWMLYRVKY